MDLDWTENSWKCWIGMRNGLGMGWTGLIQNIRTGFWTVPNYDPQCQMVNRNIAPFLGAGR